MKTRCIFALVLALFSFGFAHGAKGPAVTDPAKAAEDPDFSVQGEYAASAAIGAKAKPGGYGLQVVALGDGAFQAALYAGGLPGSGTESNEFVPLKGASKEGETTLSAPSGEKVVIAGGKATGSKNGKALFAYDRVERRSPTLGEAAPKGAAVLFDGEKGVDRFSDGKKLDGKLLKEGVVSKDSFGDFTLHLEFRTPYKPHTKPGSQDRGNSGVYIFNNYETQVLDSFGIKGEFNFCGALYRKKAPDRNMCLPPLAWQTYDIAFTAPRFDKDGNKVKNARITTRHNGVLIHNDFELLKGTGAGGGRPEKMKGQIHLQGHGNPVRFRNIWLVEKK